MLEAFKNSLEAINNNIFNIKNRVFRCSHDLFLPNKLDLTFTSSLIANRYFLTVKQYNNYMRTSQSPTKSFDTCLFVMLSTQNSVSDACLDAIQVIIKQFGENEIDAINITKIISGKRNFGFIVFGISTHLQALSMALSAIQEAFNETAGLEDKIIARKYAFYPIHMPYSGSTGDYLRERMEKFTLTSVHANPMVMFTGISKGFVELDTLHPNYHHESLMRELCSLPALSFEEKNALTSRIRTS